MTRAYLDHAATSPLRAEVLAAMFDAAARVGNPSAVTAEGRAARALVEGARSEVAALLGFPADAVTFTSGGTEGAATLLRPGYGGAERLIVSAVEHSAVMAGGGFAPADRALVPVDREGRVRLDALDALLARPGKALVAVMAVNNETGVVQDIAAISRLVRAHGGVLVSDWVQAIGKIDGRPGDVDVDAAFVSAHKIGGPQGVGAIASRLQLVPLLNGGGQEGRRRAGTENVAGLAGFAAAARSLTARGASERAEMTRLRALVESETRPMSCLVVGRGAPRAANVLSLQLADGTAETAVIALDLSGVSIAAGSACASGKVAPSHVLTAMGYAPDEARRVIRVSFGWSSTEDEARRFVVALERHLRTAGARRPAA